MIRRFLEKRRSHPSTIVPLLFFLLEMILMWLVLSIMNWNLNIGEWNDYSYLFTVIWIVYSGYKLYLVFKRQKKHIHD